MTNLTIRTATTQDEAQIVALWQVCGLTTRYNDPVHDFRFALGKPNSDVLVGVNDAGQVVGCVMVGHDGHRGWPYYVSVDPACQKKGFGRSLMDAAQKWLKDRGIVKIMLIVRDTNTQVVSFYEQLGFEVIPRVVMQKWL